MSKLETVCGAGYSMTNGADIYYASYGVCITNTAQGITSDYLSYTKYTDTYTRYISKSLAGVQYAAGHWE